MNPRIRLPILVLAVSSLACTVFVGGPALPDPPVSSSPEAFATMQATLAQAVLESLLDGTLDLTFTQEQMTAYLTSWLSTQKNPIISQPQVVFGEQEVVVYGRTRTWIFEANVAATAEFEVADSGLPQILISRVQVGPLPMPKVIRETVAAAVDEALTGYLGPVAIGFRLEHIEILGGVMTVSGRLR